MTEVVSAFSKSIQSAYRTPYDASAAYSVDLIIDLVEPPRTE